MALHAIDGKTISDWAAFHAFFSAEFGFPSFYGKNMDAWIECIDDVDDGDTITTLLVHNAKYLKMTSPQIYDAFIECSAFVNWRHVSQAGQPVLALAFHE